MDSKRSGGEELGDRWRSGVLSLEVLESGRPCELEAQRLTLGSGAAKQGGARSEGILRVAGAVERAPCRAPRRWSSRRAPSPPGLRSPLHAFAGQRSPDGI